MTHFFVVTETEMSMLAYHKAKKFDLLKFGRAVSIDDTIIYQMEEEPPLQEGEERQGCEGIPQEYSVTIDFILSDSDGALKKGYIAVGFKEK